MRMFSWLSEGSWGVSWAGLELMSTRCVGRCDGWRVIVVASRGGLSKRSEEVEERVKWRKTSGRWKS